jgi:hypothetical protein
MVASGHPHRTPESRVQVRLQPQRILGRQLVGRDAASGATFQEGGPVVHVSVVERNEEPAVLLERSRGDASQDAILGDALDRRLGVLDRVAGAAVQQPMVTSGGAGGDLPTLDQRDRKLTQDQIVRERASGPPATHDDDVRPCPTRACLIHPPSPPPPTVAGCTVS